VFGSNTSPKVPITIPNRPIHPINDGGAFDTFLRFMHNKTPLITANERDQLIINKNISSDKIQIPSFTSIHNFIRHATMREVRYIGQ